MTEQTFNSRKSLMQNLRRRGIDWRTMLIEQNSGGEWVARPADDPPAPVDTPPVLEVRLVEPAEDVRAVRVICRNNLADLLAVAPVDPATDPAPRGPSKRDVVVSLVLRPEGASHAELCAATGWRQCRDYLRKSAAMAGVEIERRKVDGESRYFGSRPQ